MATYAKDTQVSSDQSLREIERTLERYGAHRFMYGKDTDRAIIGFEMQKRQIRFVVPLPDRKSREFTQTETGRDRSANSQREVYEKAIRQRWRAMALVIKAKLEGIEAGILTFEQEFLGNIVLADGRTVGEMVIPNVQAIYETGKMVPLLPEARR